MAKNDSLKWVEIPLKTEESESIKRENFTNSTL